MHFRGPFHSIVDETLYTWVHSQSCDRDLTIIIHEDIISHHWIIPSNSKATTTTLKYPDNPFSRAPLMWIWCRLHFLYSNMYPRVTMYNISEMNSEHCDWDHSASYPSDVAAHMGYRIRWILYLQSDEILCPSSAFAQLVKTLWQDNLNQKSLPPDPFLTYSHWQ